jgi:hypothetical protein
MMAVMPLYQVILKVGDSKLAYLTVEAKNVSADENYYKLDTNPENSFFAREHTIGVVQVDSIRRNVSSETDPSPGGTVKRSSGVI